MTDWRVRRWARYGHERLYAETPGGTALGHFDVRTGRYHCDDHANLPLLQKAISDHLAARRSAVGDDRGSLVPDAPSTAPSPAPGAATGGVRDAPTPAAPITAPPAPHPPAATPRQGPAATGPAAAQWIDLSGVPAGAAAQAQALTARAAQGRVTGFLARLFDLRTEERAWRIGALGERAVAEQLARLGPEWRVLHAVRVGTAGSDIDHVVIGPPGVFTVNTKHHPDASVWVGGSTFMVNGRRVPYIRNSRHEARRAGRLLTEHAGFPVEATGLIAVMGAQRGFTVRAQPEGGEVVIVTRRQIARHLRTLPPRLRSREIEAIFDVARRSTTWT